MFAGEIDVQGAEGNDFIDDVGIDELRVMYR